MKDFVAWLNERASRPRIQGNFLRLLAVGALTVTLGSACGSPTVTTDDSVNSCAPGQTACNGWCVDLSNNALSCGACGVACATGSACAAGACQCQAGLSACATGCADVNGDGNNCGACGVVCGAGTVCSLGACSSSCAPGLTQCGASCIDPMSDVSNCGGCGLACGSGMACVAGACECPAGQTCDQGTPIGTGGGSSTGGASATGGAPATGGATATGGTAATGGNTSTGGAGTGGESGNPLENGGYISSVNWYGYAFTSAYGSATISPDDFGEFNDWPLCASGNVPASTVGAHGAMIGWSINQEPEDGAPANAVTPTLDGIHVKASHTGAKAQLRLQIQGPKGHLDAADCVGETGPCGPTDRWCADIGTADAAAGATVTWEQFNTECWPGGDGVDYNEEPLSQVLVMVPAAGAAATPYNFCIDELFESTSEGVPGGEGCDLGAGVNSPISGTMTMANALNRQKANLGSPGYMMQNNAFSPTGGMEFDLNYAGNSFTVTKQTGNRAANGAPVAYPSLFVGSDGGHGAGTAGSNLPKQVSSLSDVPTAWSWTPPSGGEYNVAYDVWFSPNGADQGPGNRSFLMVWFHKTGGVYAEGEGEGHSAGTFSIGGKNFNVYVSTQFEGRPIISYVATSQITEWSFDLNDFITDSLTRSSTGNGGKPAITSNLYLTNIFAGFEIWSGSQNIKTNAFCAEVK